MTADPHDKPPVSHEPPGPPATMNLDEKDARNWAMLIHLSAPLLLLLGVSLLGLGFLAPLGLWLWKRNDHPFIEDQGKEAVNFNISLIILYAIAVAITIATCGMAFLVLFVPAIIQVVFGVIAAIKASSGEYYRYPLTIRFLR